VFASLLESVGTIAIGGVPLRSDYFHIAAEHLPGAARVMHAIESTCEGAVLTPDLGGTSAARQSTDAIVNAL
jgi:hypothetical protein